MNKEDFLAQLRKRLSDLPLDNIEERLTFYGEIIEDRMEEGLSEAEAVSAVGTVDEIAAQAIADIPIARIAKERIKSKRRPKVWENVLLALGSPLWISLGIAAVAVILSVYISLWAAIISLWAVFVSLVGCSLGSIAAWGFFTCNGNALSGAAMVGVGIICMGLSIFMFYGCNAATKGISLLTKKITVWIKNCFIRKEEA